MIEIARICWKQWSKPMYFFITKNYQQSTENTEDLKKQGLEQIT